MTTPAPRAVLGRYIEQLGHEWDQADDMAGALDSVRAAREAGQPYDLILVDLEMPDDGAIDLVRELGEDLQDGIEVVLVGPLSQRHEIDGGALPSTTRYLNKPVQPDAVRRLLTEPAVEQHETHRQGPATAPTRDAPGGERLLVAEDNPVNRRVALLMLRKLGYQVDLVVNGAEAVEAAMRTDYAAILMDCQMPEMNGFDAVQEIRRGEGDGEHRIIIALTANAMAGDEERCLAIGMDDYLAKPVDLASLGRTLARWIRAAD